MAYNPPLCEVTGIRISKSTDIKLNNTTTRNQELETLNGLRYIQYEPATFSQDINGYQNTEHYRLYLQNPDEIAIGNLIKFNSSKYMQKTLYNPAILDTITLEVKQVENYQMGCNGYIEVICVSYN